MQMVANMNRDVNLVKKYKQNSNIKEMFNAIAPAYDFLNHFLSFSIDSRWRRKVATQIVEQNKSLSNNCTSVLEILDASTGTGDMAFAIAKKTNCNIVGFDISDQMLKIAKKKSCAKKLKGEVSFREADVINLPFENNRFDICTIGFGCRNFEFLEKGLCEIYRVLKPSGKIIILEFSIPRVNIFKQIYSFYFYNILPQIGKIISKNKNAYLYLPASVTEFPNQEIFIELLKKVGFSSVNFELYTFGVVTNYTAYK